MDSLILDLSPGLQVGAALSAISEQQTALSQAMRPPQVGGKDEDEDKDLNSEQVGFRVKANVGKMQVACGGLHDAIGNKTQVQAQAQAQTQTHPILSITLRRLNLALDATAPANAVQADIALMDGHTRLSASSDIDASASTSTSANTSASATPAPASASSTPQPLPQPLPYLTLRFREGKQTSPFLAWRWPWARQSLLRVGVMGEGRMTLTKVPFLGLRKVQEQAQAQGQ